MNNGVLRVVDVNDILFLGEGEVFRSIVEYTPDSLPRFARALGRDINFLIREFLHHDDGGHYSVPDVASTLRRRLLGPIARAQSSRYPPVNWPRDVVNFNSVHSHWTICHRSVTRLEENRLIGPVASYGSHRVTNNMHGPFMSIREISRHRHDPHMMLFVLYTTLNSFPREKNGLMKNDEYADILLHEWLCRFLTEMLHFCGDKTKHYRFRASPSRHPPLLMEIINAYILFLTDRECVLFAWKHQSEKLKNAFRAVKSTLHFCGPRVNHYFEQSLCESSRIQKSLKTFLSGDQWNDENVLGRVHDIRMFFGKWTSPFYGLDVGEFRPGQWVYIDRSCLGIVLWCTSQSVTVVRKDDIGMILSEVSLNLWTHTRPNCEVHRYLDRDGNGERFRGREWYYEGRIDHFGRRIAHY